MAPKLPQQERQRLQPGVQKLSREKVLSALWEYLKVSEAELKGEKERGGNVKQGCSPGLLYPFLFPSGSQGLISGRRLSAGDAVSY